MISDHESPIVERRLPTVLQLQAAWYVARVVEDGGTTILQLRQSYLAVPTGGLHNQASLLTGQQLLVDEGLLLYDERLIPHEDLIAWRPLPADAFVEALLERILTRRNDMWLPAFASSEQVFWERVPKDAASLLHSVFEDTDRRDSFVLSTARKVDAALLAAIGADGEEAVVTECRTYLEDKGRPDLAKHVARLSLDDDTLGYDVTTPDCWGRRHLLEVKCTRSISDRIEFYLSRNEAHTGKRNPLWSVVVARQEINAAGELSVRVVGWLTYSDLEDALPTDAEPADNMQGRWANARLTLPDITLRAGLPLDRD